MSGAELDAEDLAVLRRIADDMRSEAATLAARVVRMLPAELAAYAGLPAEQLDGDVRDITTRSITAFVEHLGRPTGSPMPPEVLSAVAASAAQRAEEGVEMGDVVRAYFLGAQHMLQVVHARHRDQSGAVVAELTARLIDYLQAVTAAVADGYHRERQLTLGEELSARLQLGKALVDGGDVPTLLEAASLAGLQLASGYAVIAVRVVPHFEPGADDGARWTPGLTGSRTDVVHARALRRTRQHLLQHLGPDVLWLPHYRDGLVLVPVRGEADEGELDPAAITSLLAGSGISVFGGLAHGRTEAAGVAQAARTAIEVRDLADRLGRRPGCYGIVDVALEYQMSRPGPAQQALADLVEPLGSEPVLLSTLEIFVAENRHRSRSARRLQVHPNTIDNRLRRIAALTGLDPFRQEDMTRLQAAIAARATDGGHR
ncbi:helix-turn-helix domain-containing protein [Nocardioides sp. NPDC127503]|uniref:PucR family transcriptional regulator n=1 Tax=Nocardioides sp. NPDC127503 TaxID=3154516 RepID=UPI00331CEC4C